MKNSGKTMIKLAGVLAVFLLAAFPAFSQSIDKTMGTLKSASEKFVNEFAKSIPLNSAVGLNWSDAFIGQTPPHFGIGTSVGFTTVNFNAISGFMNSFGLDMPSDHSLFKNIGFPLPAYTAELRLGAGTALPIDIGFKFGLLKPDWALYESLMDRFSLKNSVEYEYMLIGGELRYVLINKKVVPFMMSIGLGVNYLKGGFTPEALDSISFRDDNNLSSLKLNNPLLDVEWNSINFELKTQISFPLRFFTPYTGLGLNYSLVTAGYEIRTNEPSGSIDAIIRKALEEAGFTGISENGNGFEYSEKSSVFDIRAFGGFSFNLIVVRLDLTAMYYFLSRNVGATLGFRVQL